MDAYIVIGNPNTRKSSLIRSLTGCFNRSRRDIELVNGKQIRLYARVGSLQATKTTAEDFIVEAEAAKCDAVICCLASTSSPLDASRYPSADSYLAIFKEHGWKLRAIAVLGQNTGGIRSLNMRQFTQSGTSPINATAHAVRKHFGWL